jgi:hypothetical protein
MSVEEAVGMTQMAFRSLELRLFEGGAISVIEGAEFVRPGPTFRTHGIRRRQRAAQQHDENAILPLQTAQD